MSLMFKSSCSLWFAISSFAVCASASGGDPPGVGDPAPAFEAVDDKGKAWKSADHVGKDVIVVFFYPADMTRQCTRQVTGFQQRLVDLQKRGVKVVGISGDTPQTHQLFKKLHSVKFPLLSDANGKVARSFGVPVRTGGKITRVIDGQQKILTRKVTPQRWTFVIGKDGSIIHRDTDVDAPKNCVNVLKVVDRLTVSAD